MNLDECLEPLRCHLVWGSYIYIYIYYLYVYIHIQFYCCSEPVHIFMAIKGFGACTNEKKMPYFLGVAFFLVPLDSLEYCSNSNAQGVHRS